MADDETPLLYHVVDYKGHPVTRSKSGGWRSAAFIIGVEVAERFSYYGISSNLINYLTGPLGQSTATAAINVNAWSGVGNLLTLLGAFFADSYIGRYYTIITASILYILGLGFLTLSAILLFHSSNCRASNTMAPCSPPQAQVIFFFFSLYLVALAQGGHRPCVQAFGADQFDEQDPEECKAKSSFFNWWHFGICFGVLVTRLVLSYIQDNISWGLGFAIPCLVVGLALILFLLGTMTYRYRNCTHVQNPFLRIGRVFISAARNRRITSSTISMEEESEGMSSHQGSHQFEFLYKALVAPDGSKVGDREVCSINDVKAAETILRLVPIWFTCLVYAIVYSQSSTLFTKQSLTMDRSIINSSFEIPSASMQSVVPLTVIVFLPIYDRILVPITRVVTGIPSGITMLQRVGNGMVLSLLAMVIAALVERKRLETAREYGLVDNPNATVPMSVWWLVPQYLLFGISDAFTTVGLTEFFYDQVPNELRSIGLALYLTIFGIGSFLSSILISVIEKATGGEGRDNWLFDNLNRAHFDYFYWLLAGMSVLALVPYLYFSKSYFYKIDVNVDRQDLAA